jgi:hypothetical protein
MIGEMETQFFADYVRQACHPLTSGGSQARLPLDGGSNVSLA